MGGKKEYMLFHVIFYFVNLLLVHVKFKKLGRLEKLERLEKLVTQAFKADGITEMDGKLEDLKVIRSFILNS